MFAFARIRGESSSNDRTYFGRLVEHPCDGEPVDQFTRIIRRLRTYGHNGNHAAPVYEASLPVPALVEQDISDTGEPAGDPSDDAPKLSLAIYTPRSDGNYLALPQADGSDELSLLPDQW